MGYPWKSEKIKPAVDENCNVSENLMKIAKKELREDKHTREQALQQLRNWINKNPDIENLRSDDQFLLRFLRVKKFSVPMAEQVLLKYLNLRKTYPHMSMNLDFLEPRVNSFMSNGYIFASPIRDRHGRRVVIMSAKGINPKIHTSTDQAKSHFITYETLMEDTETQILGLTHIADFSGVTTAHVTNWNPTEFARVFKWGEQSFPLRHKEIYLVNVPSSLKWVVDFVKNRVSAKIKNRFHCYTNVKDLHKHVDPDCLPQELGGKILMADMVESWKKELIAKRDLVINLDKMNLLSDRGITTSKNNNISTNSDGGIMTQWNPLPEVSEN
uniref:CRAL-TRIO domain-containing protein n=1 Tax=Megaselia scalaris TaxID=36166 RepID=T1GSY0_MEGSC